MNISRSTIFKYLRLLSVISILSLFCFVSKAQQITGDTLYSAIGIDANFINNFLPLDNSIGQSDNYLIHFIKYKNDNKFGRHALNLDVFSRLRRDENDPNVDDYAFLVNYKIGEGRTKTVFKNGLLHYGFEFLFDYEYDKRVNEVESEVGPLTKNTNLDQNIGFGLGPFVGLQYKISSRFSIYTELGYTLSATYLINSFKSEEMPGDDFKDTIVSFRDTFRTPRSIIIFYHF